MQTLVISERDNTLQRCIRDRYEDNPEREEENRPARAGTMRRPRFTIFGALLFVLLMPFRFIGSLTRNIRWFICWPLRILSLIHI